MRTATRWCGLVTTIFVLVGASALANPVRGGASATPKVTKSSSAGPKTPSPSKGATMKATKSTTPKGHSATAKTKIDATTRTSTKSGTTTTPSTTTSHTPSDLTTTSSGGTVTTVSGATWTPTNAMAQKLSTKSNILKKVQTTLGTVDLNGATAGFKTFGQFVAAINVSNNHDIAFADLKAAMTGMDMKGQPVLARGTTDATSGTTAVTTMSLGQAIQSLKPGGVDAETVAQTALTQANQEIDSSTTTSTSTTGTKAKPKSKS